MNKKQFLDIRNHGFLRVAAATPKVFLADPEKNSENHIKLINEAYKKGAQIIAFPELSITGYSCQDLFLSKALQDSALIAIKNITEKTHKINSLIIVGAPIIIEDKLFNTAVLILNGKILAIVPKTYLPDYREFRETRWFSTSRHYEEKEIEFLGQKVFFGMPIIKSNKNKNLRLYIDICEDLWVPIAPSAIASLNGANVLINISGSNVNLKKDLYRRDLVAHSSAKNNAACIYVSTGYGESTTDLSWDGHSIIADRGEIIAESKRYQMDSQITYADCDIEVLDQDRLRMSSYRDNTLDNKQKFNEIIIDEDLGIKESKEYEKLIRNIDKLPFVPDKKDKLNERASEIFNMQATSLARRLEALPEDARKVIIGVSGGSDSTLALLVASYTFDLLKINKKNIIGITMPGFGTTSRTKNNAIELIKSLGASFYEIDITNVAKEIFKNVDHDIATTDLTFENVQAWSRKYTELSMASKHKGIVLGTGDFSELAIGWTTMFGDHASHYGINAGIPKTLVKSIIKWAAEDLFSANKVLKDVLNDILDTPISPELLPPNEKGEIAQVTEDKVGPYELHDFYSYYFMRFGMDPVKIARLTYEAYNDEFDLIIIKKWLKTYIKKFFMSQFKRSVLPDGPKVGSLSISPRDDWKMPSDILGNNQTWLNRVDEIPDKI